MRIWRRCITSLALALLLGCGDVEGADGEADAEYTGPFILALEVDFLDVYGPIVVGVEGNETVTMREEGSFSCETSPLVVMSEDFSFEALSERFFFWKDLDWRDLPRKVEGDCITISLDGGHLATSVFGIYQQDERLNPCFPWDYRMTIHGKEVSLGMVRRSWTLRDSEEVFPAERVIEPLGVRRHRLFTKAREGKLVVAGGWRRVGTPFEYYGIPPAHCPDDESSGSGRTEIGGSTGILGVSVGSW